MNVFADLSNEITPSSDDDNLDDIDLDQLFNDFDEKQSYPPVAEKPKQNVHYVSRLPLAKYNENTPIRDEMIEFNASDCRSPIKFRKTIKKKTANKKQTTMYDYAESISYKNKQFCSSFDNSTTTKTIVKTQKRPFKEEQQSTSLVKKQKVIDKDAPSLSPPPDFIDNLMRYLDDRSHTTLERPVQEQPRDDAKKKKSNSLFLFKRV